REAGTVGRIRIAPVLHHEAGGDDRQSGPLIHQYRQAVLQLEHLRRWDLECTRLTWGWLLLAPRLIRIDRLRRRGRRLGGRPRGWNRRPKIGLPRYAVHHDTRGWCELLLDE